MALTFRSPTRSPFLVSPDPTGMHRQHCDGSVSYIRRDKAAGQRVESGFARPIKFNTPRNVFGDGAHL